MKFLTKPKCSKPIEIPRVDMETKFQESAKKAQPVRPVLHTGQTDVPCPRANPVHQTCPTFLPSSRVIYRTCLVLD
jgi:hypothetical protein